MRYEGVQIDPGKTTTISVAMQEAVIEGEEVTVTAERPIVEVDRTTTTSVVTSDQLEALPVTTIGDAINLQAGIVDGHFRGGRQSEVAYLVNGVPINNVFTQQASFEVEQNMVENLEVVSGVFNAEYGQALSGVVNITTKDVPRGWNVGGQAYVGAIASERKLEFVRRTAPAGSGLLAEDFTTEKVTYAEAAPFPSQFDVQGTLGGPILRDRVGIRLSGRYLQNEGHLLSRRLFAPGDSSQRLTSGNPGEFLLESTGDQSFMAQGGGTRGTFNGSLVMRPIGPLRIDYNAFIQTGKNRPYQHYRKYAPEGTNINRNFTQTHILGARYALGAKAFANAAYSYLRDHYTSHLYDDLTGPYVSSNLGSLAGTNAFAVSGNDLYDVDNTTETHNVQADFTVQATRIHLVKTGVQARFHSLRNRTYGIQMGAETGYVARISPNPLDNNALTTNPYEFAAFVQDKVELRNLIVNVGLRFDLFEPDYLVPIDWAQGQLVNVPNTATPDPADSLYNRQPAARKVQLSPRLGIAFPISATGVLRFSAGLFFQTPRFDLLYANPEFEAQTGGANAFFGNPDLEPERTLTFELGLQQALTDQMGLEVTVFSKDIRNLTGQEITRLPEGNFAVRNRNVDVGTVRGITFSAFQRGRGPLSWTLDYTLQFAEGTASDPGEAFGRQQSGEEAIVSLVRLNWDRRHVLNSTLTIEPARGFQATFINRVESGTPYTTLRNDIRSFLKNDDSKPAYFLSDLRLLYRPPFVKQDVNLLLQITNLLDTEVQAQVYDDTGLATESLTKERFIRSGTTVGGVNTLDDLYYNPTFFGAPRRVSLGLRFDF